MDKHPINQKLIDSGWKEEVHTCPTDRHIKMLYFKSFENHEACKANPGKPKVVEIAHHFKMHIHNVFLNDSWDVTIYGCLPDNSWVTLRADNLKSFEEIENKVDKLLTAWDLMVKSTPYVKDPYD